MALLSTTKTWLDVAATTIENFRPNFVDQVTDAIPLVKIANQMMSTRLDGGDQIVEELMYAFNNTVKSYSRFDEIDLTPQKPITAARYDWSDIAGSMVIAQDDIDRNAGQAQQLNLLQAKLKNLKISFQNSINTMLYGDGTGNENKDLIGLSLLVDGFGTATVGGVARNDETWWRNVAYSYLTSGADGIAQGGASNSGTARSAVGFAADDFDTTFLFAVDHVFTEVVFGDTGPDIGICSMPAWTRLRRAVIAQKRFDMSDTSRVDPGFRHVNVNGVPVVPDRNIPSATFSTGTATQRFWWINMDFMNFYKHMKKDFIATEFYPLRPRQDAWAMNMFLKAQLTVSKSNAHAVLHSISS